MTTGVRAVQLREHGPPQVLELVGAQRPGDRVMVAAAGGGAARPVTASAATRSQLRGTSRSIADMKERLSLSVDAATVRYLDLRAKQETDGNVSAMVDRIIRDRQLAEAVQAEAAWYAAHPGHAETAEAERNAAGRNAAGAA